MKCFFGGDVSAFFYGDSLLMEGVPSELVTRYSVAPSMVHIILRTSSTLMSWIMVAE